jgi:hypothetical protein
LALLVVLYFERQLANSFKFPAEYENDPADANLADEGDKKDKTEDRYPRHKKWSSDSIVR